MAAPVSALISFLFQASLLSWTARFYQSPGWTNSPGLLLADRLVYALIMPGLGLLLLCLFIPRLLNLSVGTPRFWLFRPGSGRLAGLLWALGGAMLMFGMVYLVSELLQAPTRSGGLADEIRRAPSIGIFMVTTGLLTPVLEELYYRGLLQEFLQRGGSLQRDTNSYGGREAGSGTRGAWAWAAILVQALCFGLVHARNGLVPALMLFVGGLGLGILYWRYGLASSILAHSSYNLAILIHFQA